ncbi:MAG TPA: hypothetical protein VKN82_02210, partial [Desulfohalobiaceae bacterium]|nr:hypothetical protein [Desulfohalobiaceae bacterium]
MGKIWALQTSLNYWQDYFSSRGFVIIEDDTRDDTLKVMSKPFNITLVKQSENRIYFKVYLKA